MKNIVNEGLTYQNYIKVQMTDEKMEMSACQQCWNYRDCHHKGQLRMSCDFVMVDYIKLETIYSSTNFLHFKKGRDSDRIMNIRTLRLVLYITGF